MKRTGPSMATSPGPAVVFFKQIRAKLPPNISFVHDISELLGIGYDSAYRRIRGEKTLSLGELHTLSMNYGISLDSLFNVKDNNVIFSCHALDAIYRFRGKDWEMSSCFYNRRDK